MKNPEELALELISKYKWLQELDQQKKDNSNDLLCLDARDTIIKLTTLGALSYYEATILAKYFDIDHVEWNYYGTENPDIDEIDSLNEMFGEGNW